MAANYWNDLGYRWVALGLDWRPGMVTMGGIRVSHGVNTHPGGIRDGDSRERWPVQEFVTSAESVRNDDSIPNLKDPATLGCLPVQAWKAWGCVVWVEPTGRRWCIRPRKVSDACGGGMPILFESPAEAYVTALETAEVRP